MKVNGKKLTGPRIVKKYLMTGDDEAVEFCFRPLKSDEDFSKVLSRPKPPQVIKPGGVIHYNEDDKNFKAAIADWSSKKFDWEFLQSISATDSLEWETVSLANPESWKNWRTEITEHFGENQSVLLFNAFVEAQFVTEESVERARQAFLTGRRVMPELSQSPTEDQTSSQSGEPANA